MSVCFTKGDIIHFDFKNDYLPAQHPQYTIIGPHYAVVLFYGGPQRKIITVAPVTSLYDKNGQKKQLRQWDMELQDNAKYNFKNPSYIIMDQIHTLNCDGIELKTDKIPLDNTTDIPRLNICLVTVFELFEAVNKIAELKLKTISETLLEQFNDNILMDVKNRVNSEILTDLSDILLDIIQPIDVDAEIKNKLSEEFKKENLKANDLLSKKIIKIIKDVIHVYGIIKVHKVAA